MLIGLVSGCDQGHAIIDLDIDPGSTETQPQAITIVTGSPGTPFPTFTVAPTRTAFSLPTQGFSGEQSIGRSVEGRIILAYRFGNGKSNKLLVGGIHGGSEWNTTSLLYKLIDVLNEDPGLVPQNVTLYIIPCLNPDGAEKGDVAEGRVNGNGVDLNRNWDANWQLDWPRAGCWNQIPTSGGVSSMSEPEVKALASFVLYKKFNAIISYHSAGLGIFPGGIPPTSSSKSLAESVADASPYPYPPVDTGCLYTGMFVDWAAIQGIAALDVELQNHFDEDLAINLRVLKAFLTWTPDQ